MKDVEEIHPLPSHPSFFDDWYMDIEEFWESTGEKFPKEGVYILSLRKQVFELSFGMQPLAVQPLALQPLALQPLAVQPLALQPLALQPKDWKWLLTVDQMPQRTANWYAQKMDMLTASEISNLWKGPRARINLIASKSAIQEPSAKRLATLRVDTNPMDWGVRYEPIVKMLLERDGSRIHELGRIQHRIIPGLAASPDGLYVSGPLEGSLVEIKCPISRIIDDKIPFDYWCQMQIQMEVCDIDTCEFVEAKFKEGDETPGGYISLLLHREEDSDEMKYVYHDSPVCTIDANEPWICIETYSWSCASLRRTIVPRDVKWFEKIQSDIALFWTEVADVREGRRILTPAKKKVPVVQNLAYSFVD